MAATRAMRLRPSGFMTSMESPTENLFFCSILHLPWPSACKGDFGYNARTDVYENLHAAGVVDPAKVARVALENAASIAGMFLTTECVIVEKKEDKPEMPMGAPGMGGMGGMM